MIRTRAPLIFLLLAYGTTVLACTPEEEVSKKCSPWNYVGAADNKPVLALAYDVRRTGFHTAEVHFKNFTANPVEARFCLTGFQTQSFAARIPSSYPDDIETIVPVTLTSGANGVTFAALKEVQGTKSSTQTAQSGTELWLPLVPLRPTIYFTQENVSCQIRGQEILFRNHSRNALYFDFSVSGYQAADVHNPRVTLNVGEQRAIPIVLEHSDALLAFARVKAFNIRTDVDAGEFLDPAELEDGWFRVTSVNSQNINPNQIVYRIDPLDDARIQLRFRNISRMNVAFNFGLGDAGMTGRAEIGAEGEKTILMAYPHAAAERSLARVKVANVQYTAARDSTVATKTPAANSTSTTK